MTGKPSLPIAIEVCPPTWFAGPSTVVITGATGDWQTPLPSALTPRRYCPTGQIAANRVCTWLWSIWAAPIAPAATMLDTTPPVAIERLPLAVIGPPASPAPLPTLTTVPPLLVSVSMSVPQVQVVPAHFATSPFAHASPATVAAFDAKIALATGVSSCRGESVV